MQKGYVEVESEEGRVRIATKVGDVGTSGPRGQERGARRHGWEMASRPCLIHKKA